MQKSILSLYSPEIQEKIIQHGIHAYLLFQGSSESPGAPAIIEKGEKGGAEFEDLLEAELRKTHPLCLIERTSHEWHSGDIVLTTEGGRRILIEAKSYSKTVGQEEVTKFVSDVFNPSLKADAGVFVVNGAFIANKPKIHFEELQEGDKVANSVDSQVKPVVYLSDESADTIDVFIEAVQMISAFLNKCEEGPNTEAICDETISVLDAGIKKAELEQEYLEKAEKQIGEYIKDLRTMRLQLNNAISE